GAPARSQPASATSSKPKRGFAPRLQNGEHVGHHPLEGDVRRADTWIVRIVMGQAFGRSWLTRGRLLWLARALCACGVAWSVLESPGSLLLAVPAGAVCVLVLGVRGPRATDGTRLEQMAAAFRSSSGAASQLDVGIQELLGSARKLFHASYAE